MPRSFSSFRRSVSRPVSALMSVVLPWSMCPAVPSVRPRGLAQAASARWDHGATGRSSSTRKRPGHGFHHQRQFVGLQGEDVQVEWRPGPPAPPREAEPGADPPRARDADRARPPGPAAGRTTTA